MCQNVIKKPRLYLYISLPSIIIWLFIQIMVAYEARNDGLLIIIPIIFFICFPSFCVQLECRTRSPRPSPPVRREAGSCVRARADSA